MKKIILILLFLPFSTWSQSLDFTEEQEAFVLDFLKKLEKKIINISVDDYFKEMDEALVKAPYHPRLVEEYLRNKFFVMMDFKFVSDYCSRLEDAYLSTNQSILVDPCASAYVFSENHIELYNRIIPLTNDENLRELFLSFYYFGAENYDDFIKYARKSVTKNFNYKSQMMLRDLAFQYLVVILNLYENVNDFSTFIKDYEDTIFSTDLSIPIYNVLIQSSVFNSDFLMAEKLLDYVKNLETNNYKYLYPISALYYSYKGDQSLAIKALDNALNLEISDFEKITHAGDISKDIFNLYSMSIRELEDFNTKERLINKAIIFFEDRNDYRIRFKLFQSLLYASEDFKRAKSILNEIEPYLKEQNVKDLEHIFKMENELGKKKPDYRLVDNLISKMLPNLNLSSLDFQRILYRYKVNYNSKRPVFTLNEIVEELDKLLERPLDRQERLRYLQFKILLIGENDRESAIKELEKLPEDLANEIISDFESTENNPEKISEFLISNRKELEDINGSINLINVSYINVVQLKE
jgi:hypothetical protein